MAVQKKDQDMDDLADEIKQISIDVPDVESISIYLETSKTTQADAASQIGIDPSTLSRWLNGEIPKVRKGKKQGGQGTDTTYKISLWWRSVTDKEKKKAKEQRKTDVGKNGYVFIGTNIDESSALCLIDYRLQGFRNIPTSSPDKKYPLKIRAIVYFDDAEAACARLHEKFDSKMYQSTDGKKVFNVPVRKALEALFDLGEAVGK